MCPTPNQIQLLTKNASTLATPFLLASTIAASKLSSVTEVISLRLDPELLTQPGLASRPLRSLSSEASASNLYQRSLQPEIEKEKKTDQLARCFFVQKLVAPKTLGVNHKCNGWNGQLPVARLTLLSPFVFG